jgi:hypothetical protein
MKQTILAVSVVTLSSLVLGGCNLLSSKGEGATQTQQEVVGEARQFSEAIRSGKPTLCTMTKGDDKMEYWVKGKMFKMNAITTIKNEDTGVETQSKSYMISDSEYMYSWGDTQQQGIKIKIPSEQEMAEMSDAAKEYQSQAPNFEDEESYQSLESEGYAINCKEVSISDGDFAVPKNIQFVDPTEMMKAVAPQGNGGQIDMKKLEEMAKQYEGMDN